MEFPYELIYALEVGTRQTILTVLHVSVGSDQSDEPATDSYSSGQSGTQLLH